MQSDLGKELSERFIEYQHFRNEGAYHAALKRLAEISHCIPQLDRPERSKWAERLRKEALTEEIIRAVKDGMEEDAQRIRRIFSHGSVWNDEEILLVLTIRIQIDLALAFLNERAVVTVATDDIDEQMVHISKTSQNRRSFEVAIKLINANWGLPIRSKWLRKDLSVQNKIVSGNG